MVEKQILYSSYCCSSHRWRMCIFIPPFITSYGSGDSLPILRQTILAATGGVLAILTLWENRRKNDQEHMRQVHAERRSRYATAIEQLADEKAPIRLGGVYTLVKLVDEWLADEKTLPNEEERREEGQAIINSLCAYIRSPFDLASKSEVLSENEAPENYEGGDQQFIKDQARFRQEKELRLTVLDAIKIRLNNGINTQEDGTKKLLKVFGQISIITSQTQFSSTRLISEIVISTLRQVLFRRPSFNALTSGRRPLPRALTSPGRPSPRLASLGRNSPRTPTSPERPSPRTLTSPGRPSPRLASLGRNSPRTPTSPERPSPRTLTSPERPSPRTLTSPERPSPRTLTSPERPSPRTLTSPERPSPRTPTSPRRNSPRLTSLGRNSPGLLASPGRNSPRLASLGRNSPRLASLGRNSPRLASLGRPSLRTPTSPRRPSLRTLTSPGRPSLRTPTSPRRNSPRTLASLG